MKNSKNPDKDEYTKESLMGIVKQTKKRLGISSKVSSEHKPLGTAEEDRLAANPKAAFALASLQSFIQKVNKKNPQEISKKIEDYMKIKKKD